MKERMPKVTKGQTFYAVDAEKTEHFTSPPKPYSEDTLLAAMETAGNKEFDEDTEKKGLGTPATRACIIEKLIYSHSAVILADFRKSGRISTRTNVLCCGCRKDRAFHITTETIQ